jgi:hypothetical protein
MARPGLEPGTRATLAVVTGAPPPTGFASTGTSGTWSPCRIRPPTSPAWTRMAKAAGGVAGGGGGAALCSAPGGEAGSAGGPLTTNDAPMGYLPVLTNLTHWPWFVNLVPKFFQPPFLHSSLSVGGGAHASV